MRTIPVEISPPSQPPPDPLDRATWTVRRLEHVRWELENLAPGVFALAKASLDNALDSQVSAIAGAGSAVAAASYTGAAPWVSGAAYTIGDVRWSPVDSGVYRRITDGAGTVDPRFDGANWKSVTPAVRLAAVNLFTAAQRGAFVTLTDAATVAIDLSLSNQFNLTLGGNRTLGVPINIAAGQQGVINIYQSATGSRVLAYSWIWGWSGGNVGVLSTAGCTKDMLAYGVDYYASGSTTVTITTPGIFTFAAHGMISGQKCQLTTTGSLPTGLTANTTYFVHVIDVNTFHLCTTLANVAAGTYIAASGAQSGTHTIVCANITLMLKSATP